MEDLHEELSNNNLINKEKEANLNLTNLQLLMENTELKKQIIQLEAKLECMHELYNDLLMKSY